MKTSKRICLLIYSLSSLIGVGILAALWFPLYPVLPLISWLMYMPWFYVLEAVLLGIVGFGILFTLFKAIITPGENAQLHVSREGGCISISKSALQSDIAHIIDSHKGMTLVKAKVHISGKKNPQIKASIKIDPGSNTQLNDLGTTLQSEIAQSLENFTGHPPSAIHVTFTKSPATAPIQSKEEAS